MLSYIINNPEEIAVKRWGDAYRTYRRLWKYAGKGEYIGEVPLYLMVDTIDACNLNCSICHQRGRVRTKKRLNVNRVIELIKEGAPKGIYSITLSAMAEPYMDFENLIILSDFCQGAGFLDIILHTNLLIPDEKMLQQTVDAGATHFCVSIDATGAETYAKIRGGDFSKVMENMCVLKDIKNNRGDGYPIIRVSGVPVAENREDMKNFTAFWKDYADVVEIQGYRADPSHKTEGTVITKKKTACSQPWTRLMLWPTGEVSFCSSKEVYSCPEAILGNYLMEDISLRDYWLGEKAWDIRRAFRKGDIQAIFSCSLCMDNSYIPDEHDFA